MTDKSVLITGAAGNLGQKLMNHLRELGGYQLIGLDKAARGVPGVVEADFSVWDPAWAAHFQGVDTVVHLGADPNPYRSWQEMIPPNMDGLAFVYNAAIQGGVKRIVFASSNHAMGRYSEDTSGTILAEDTPPRPGVHYGDGRTTTPYGAFKLVGERLGKCYADIYGISFIGVRIGWVKHDDNSLANMAKMGAWGREMWLSDRDYCQCMQRCIDADDSLRFAIINGVSNNEGMRWELESAAARVGYVPQDGITLADVARYGGESA